MEHFVKTLLNVSSIAFKSNEFIPVKYTCEGINVNPPLNIDEIPEGAKSLALIVDDPDAPAGVWVHWIVWNIPVVKEIKEDSIPGIEGINSFHAHEYRGPCPPSRTHRYYFKVYALDTLLNISVKSDKKELIEAMENHILAEGEVIGLFTRD